MRTLISALAVIAGVVSAVGVEAPAHADEVCHSEPTTYIDATGQVVNSVKEVCTSTGNGGEAGNASGGGKSGCRAEGVEIPCTRDGAYWFANHNCYATDATDMYPLPWEGHKDGAVYMCLGEGPNMMDVGTPFMFWVPPGQIPALVDPAVLARQALDQMSLAKPNIHLAPTPPQMTYVGLDTWLWMDPDQFNSLTNTVSAGGASVTVTAAPVRAAWDMGDGSGTTCGDAGRPWAKGMTSAEHTSCSYAYNRVSDFQPGGTYTVSTSLVYQVDWTCAGPCLARTGSLGEVDGPSSTSAIRVGERQTVVTNRGGTNS